jgi:hypothetical protein
VDRGLAGLVHRGPQGRVEPLIFPSLEKLVENRLPSERGPLVERGIERRVSSLLPQPGHRPGKAGRIGSERGGSDARPDPVGHTEESGTPNRFSPDPRGLSHEGEPPGQEHVRVLFPEFGNRGQDEALRPPMVSPQRPEERPVLEGGSQVGGPELPGHLDGLGTEAVRSDPVALDLGRERTHQERESMPGFFRMLPEPGQRPGCMILPPRIEKLEVAQGQVVLDHGSRVIVAGGFRHGAGLFEEFATLCHPSLQRGQRTGSEEEPGPGPSGGPDLGKGEGALDPAVRLLPEPGEEPEPPEVGHHFHVSSRRTRPRTGKRFPQVLDVGQETVHVLLPVGPGHARRRPSHLGGEEGCVPSPDPFGLTRFLEPPGAVLPDGLQKRVPGGPLHFLDLQERAVHQAGDLLQHLQRRLPLLAPHGRRAIEGESPTKDAESHEQNPGGFGEELVTPVDGRMERAMSRHDATALRGEKGKDVVEAVPDLLHAQYPDTGRGKLDGKRDAVEPPADVGHDPDDLRGQFKLPRHVARPLLEEPDGPGPGHRLRRIIRARHRETGYEPGPLPCYAQRLSARGQDRQVRTGAEEVLGHPGAGIHQMLAVVQNEE